MTEQLQLHDIITTETGRFTSPSSNMKEVPRLDRWPDCGNCHQSLTGRYRGAFGCARCGLSTQPFRLASLFSAVR